MSLIEFAIKSFSSLFIIMGPFSVLPVFISMTQNNTPDEQNKIIKKATIAAALICLVFAYAGTFFFQIFGITINSFRIAGGLLLLLMSINMLHASRSQVRVTPEEHQEGIEKDDISIFPLAIPLITGPGAISTSVLLAGEVKNWQMWLILTVNIIISAILIYFILRMSKRVYKLLGNTGLNILTRIMGLILASMAVEFILQGAKNFFVVT